MTNDDKLEQAARVARTLTIDELLERIEYFDEAFKCAVKPALNAGKAAIYRAEVVRKEAERIGHERAAMAAEQKIKGDACERVLLRLSSTGMHIPGSLREECLKEALR